MKGALLAACAAMTLAAGLAMADPLSDAKVGLASLNQGDNQNAVRLFTSALASNRLTKSDRELAYVKRAEAYLAMGDRESALADANHALDLDPRDTEAAATRDRATAPPATAKTAKPSRNARKEASAASPHALADYDAAMVKYEAERQAAADTYARELAAHDAQVARHDRDLATWQAKIDACKIGDAANCAGGVKSVAAAPAAKPGPPAVTPKPTPQQASAKPAPAAKKPVAKHFKDPIPYPPTFF